MFICAVQCACLSGCLESDVIVEKVIDQTSEEIDYDNEQKELIPDEDSDVTLDDAAALMNTDVEQVEKILEDKAVYGQDATTDETAEKAQNSDSASSRSASSELQDNGEGEETDTGSNVSDSSGSGGGSSSGNNSDPNKSGSTSASAGDDSLIFYTQYGDLADLPHDVSTVCAVGEAATMALAFGGKGALAGTSKSFKASAQAKKLFASRGLADAEVFWSGDGLSKGDLDVDALVEAAPDAVLTVSGTMAVTSSAYDTLTAAGISVIVLPALTCDTNIKTAVKVVGTIFDDATDGQSLELVDEYKSMVNSVLTAAKKTHGGKVVTYLSTDFDDVDSTSTRSDAMEPEYWTLYISDWDADAKVTALYGSTKLFTDTGVGYTYVGWDNSPISYYLGCGGALNNAAAYGRGLSGTGYRLVLAYNENQVTYSWSGLDDTVTLSKKNGTFNLGANYVLTNARDGAGNGDENEHHLGSDDFCTVIVRTADIQEAFEEALDESTGEGLYARAPYVDLSGIHGYGFTTGGVLISSFISNADADGDSEIEVIVNPTGMASSWTEGGLESFLEAPWAASIFYDYSTSDLRADVSEFYETFYGYELSSAELDKILEGDYA